MPELPPLGTPEGTRLEFKRADALRKDNRADLVRGIVAMMNAEGGTIWVGALTQEERFSGLDPLKREELDALRRRLEDAILDSIEPVPDIGGHGDLALESVEAPGGGVLAIQVEKRRGPPVCRHSGKVREFLKRSGPRIVPLSYGEIVSSSSNNSRDLEAFVNKVQKAYDDFVKAFKNLPGLAFSLVPEIDEKAEFPKRWTSIVKNPSAHLLPAHDFTWHTPDKDEYRSTSKMLESGYSNSESVFRKLRIHSTGSIHFFTSLDVLRWAQNNKCSKALGQEPKGQIYPPAIVLTIVSLVRLAAELYQDFREESLKRMGMISGFPDGNGWVFHVAHPNSPLTMHYSNQRRHWIVLDSNSHALPVKIRTIEQIVTHPDAVAYDLLEEIYSMDKEMKHEVKPGVIPWFTEDLRFVPPQ